MSEMTEERLNEIERVIRQEVRRLREDAKRQAIVAEQAAARIRELDKISDQLMKRKMELFDEKIELLEQNQKMKEVLRRFFRTAWQGDLDGGWVQDMGVEHGFLNEEIYDYEKHGDIDGLEPGDVICTLSDVLEEGK